MTSPASAIAIDAIGWYQRALSPRKGFKCAYGVLHGDGTCSSVVLSAFRSGGAMAGTREFFRQSLRCYQAAVALGDEPPEPDADADPQPAIDTDQSPDKQDDWCAHYLALEGAACCCSLPFIAS